MPQEMDDRDGLCPDAERDSEIDMDEVLAGLNGGGPGEDDAEFDDTSEDDDYEDFGPEYEDEDPDADDDEAFEGDDNFYDLDDSDDEEDGD